MGIVWFSEKPKEGIATISANNITLNKAAINDLEDAFSVMLGIDYDNLLIFIKPLSKDQDQRGDIPESSKYKITIRSSYGRITNKDFIKEIGDLVHNDFQTPVKYLTKWNQDDKLLVVNLKKCEEDA